LLDPRGVQARMQGFLSLDHDYEIRYQSIYRVHQRVAADWRRGRVLLAGDAAHLNNPLGGFGLNSGIHDAVNLAEKLAKVWSGEADDSLLERYVRQRRAATIEHVQAMSIRNKRLLEERDPQVHRSRMEELVAIAGDPQRARAYMLESSMIAGLRQSAQIE
jgi:3-(3-hydroxy-phenyl)propionate hydroxylase